MRSPYIERTLFVVTLSLIPLAWAQPKVSVDENARTAFLRALQIDSTFKKAADGMNALR